MGKLAVPRLVGLGSVIVYEFPGRNTLDEFFKHEPFRTNGLYERIEIYNWQWRLEPVPMPGDSRSAAHAWRIAYEQRERK